MDQKKQFILDYLTGKYTKKELCQAYGIGRPTGDLLLKKYEQGGFTNLGDQRKTPHTNPYQTDPEVEAAILELRKQYPRWGARKLRVLLLEDWQADCVPSAQTIHKLLRRAGLVERKRRRHRFRPQQPVFDPEKSNEIWSIDYKGKFRLGNQRYCYPLTICDSYSRYIFLAKAQYQETIANVQQGLRQAFAEYGMPEQLHSDNGAPFASIQSPQRYGTLAYWLMDHDIEMVYSDPGQPGQNGRHERMHEELKADCARPPSYDLRWQQRRLNNFVRTYNEVRPHESLEMQKPAHVHEPSPRRWTGKVEDYDYPAHFKVRRLTSRGTIRWGSSEYLKVSESAAYRWIGLEDRGGHVYDVYYRRFYLGSFCANDVAVPGKYHILQW
ncbi:DDE-type integrase/transposase/recombinase [Lewinella sp. IMCC34191]|uniref:DDE-type integrase/transposase/recombinase n=1 Tax=Lewinella sp. IMCC34191 TaxID=2259172 RepID=UPI0018E54314|nr:DDE-type integrase/transposase/recombinase [Lewinella sp. IMCC34191]